jgi:aconitate hydratase
VDIDFASEPIAKDSAGEPVHLADIWPGDEEVAEAERAVTAEIFTESYRDLFQGDSSWAAISGAGGLRFDWEAASTYIRQPPFFEALDNAARAAQTASAALAALSPITGARVLAMLGDSITTDHISPAGSIAKDSPAARYLEGEGVAPADFNSYGSRRGNHEVMMRGTFANIRLKNLLLSGGREGGVTKFFTSGCEGGVTSGAQADRNADSGGATAAQELPIYDAAMRYRDDKVPLIIIAGRDYGMGSSRDWAAKGTVLLGVRAVIAVSYERIHRSNLVGMGILPLEFLPGEDAASHGLSGSERYSLMGTENLSPGSRVIMKAERTNTADTADSVDSVDSTDSAAGQIRSFEVIARIDSAIELDYIREGGILPMMARRLAQP